MPPLIAQHTDAAALAFVDPEPSTASRAALAALVHAELPADHTTTLHPSIPAAHEPRFSPALTAEHARIAAASSSSSSPAPPPKYSMGGISTARYEALDPPSSPSSSAEAWGPALRAAYTNAAYLSQRATHLALLEQHGRNAWLVGNWQPEAVQRALDAAAAAARTQVDEVQAGRRAAQVGAAAELAALEDGWRDGVGRVVRVQLAGEEVRRAVLERRREGAV